MSPRFYSFIWLPFFICCLFSSFAAQALDTEFGTSYTYKKSTFDDDNNTEQQSATGTVSFYFAEKIALELSYTSGLYVKKEKQPNFAGAFLRTTTQFTDVYGTDLIYILADRKATFQPFIKGGVAYVRVKQVVQDDNNNPWEILYSGPSPSYGVGFKLFITQAFAFRTSYDVIQTPVNNETKINDISGRVGISWMF